MLKVIYNFIIKAVQSKLIEEMRYVWNSYFCFVCLKTIFLDEANCMYLWLTQRNCVGTLTLCWLCFLLTVCVCSVLTVMGEIEGCVGVLRQVLNVLPAQVQCVLTNQCIILAVVLSILYTMIMSTKNFIVNNDWGRVYVCVCMYCKEGNLRKI